MARTPLFAALRRSYALARLANRTDGPGAGELVALARAARREEWNRRRFLATSSLAGLGLALGCAPRKHAPRPSASVDPGAAAAGSGRVAIVGGGIAGLNAAWKLRQAGVRATVYEAAKRSGGRMYTATGLLAPGITTELGGEFIDSHHEEMLALVKELGLDLLDMEDPAEAELVREAYFFGGSHHGEDEVVEAFRPIAARIDADLEGIEDEVDFEHEGGAGELDRTPLGAYLERAGANGWFKDLLEVAYVTEYGLDAGRQSALNLLFLIGTEVDEGFQVFGESDERFKVKGGNQRVVDGLAARLGDQVRLEHRLEAVSPAGEAYRLDFAGPGGTRVTADADVVILTLPFTLLRQVDLGRIALPPWKTRAIAELGYGMNAKVMVGLDRRPWRAQGYAGNIFSDEPFQLAWDSSRFQPGEAGSLTLYSGGAPGIEAGKGTAAEQAEHLLPGVEKAFPGIAASRNGKAERFHWPSFPLSLGSYACYHPGQWTSIAGAEGRAVGRLLFAGEHTSLDFQGYMNGGAESGKRAAAEALVLLGRKSAVLAPASRPWARRRLAVPA